MILTKYVLDKILKLMKTASASQPDGALKGCSLMVYTNNVAVDKNTVLGDLTEANWTGYSRATVVVWADPFLSNDTGIPVMVGDAKTFLCTTNADDLAVQGFALVEEGSPDKLLAVEALQTPFQPGPGSGFVYLPRVGLSPDDDSPAGDLTVL